MRRALILVAIAVGAIAVFAFLARRRRPEERWEPGLEFNPDFTPTVEEIEADLRGAAPSA